MKKLLISLALVVCVLCLADAAKGPKRAPKQVRNLKKLCERDADRGLPISDGNFTEVFEDLTYFCTDFLTNYSDYYVVKAEASRKNDPIKILEGVCGWFNKRYPDGKDGIWLGFDYICEEFDDALTASQVGAVSEEPRIPNAIATLNSLCVKSVRGRLRHKNESYDEVFEDFADFCVDYANATGLKTDEEEDELKEEPDKPKQKPVLVQFDKMCDYIERKYTDPIEEGNLVGLDDICDDFKAIRYPSYT